MPAAVLKTDLVKGAWGRARRSAMLYGALATAVRVGANIMLLPLVLKILAPAELALWYVFLALGGIANLADFGFGQAIARIYSFLWAGAEDFETEGLGPPPQNQEPNRPRIRQFHAAVQRLYRRIAFIAIGLLVIVGTLFLLRPVAATANATFGWICWAAFILSIGYTLGSSYWLIACQGVNRMREFQSAQFIGGLAYFVSAALLLLMGWGLLAMVVATAIRAVVGRLLSRRAYLAAVPPQPGEGAEEVRSMVKRIWPNARKLGMISLGAYLTLQANVLICSHFLSSEITASYGLTLQVGSFIAAFSALWLAVKWPEITILRTQGQLEAMGVLFARRLALVMATFAVAAAVLLVFGNQLLAWKGTQTRFLATPLLAAYLLYLFQQQFYVQFGALVYTENVVPFFKLSMITGAAVVLLSLWLVVPLGLWGLIIAPIIVTVSSVTWYVTWRGFRGQPLSVRQFARAAVLGHA